MTVCTTATQRGGFTQWWLITLEWRVHLFVFFLCQVLGEYCSNAIRTCYTVTVINPGICIIKKQTLLVTLLHSRPNAVTWLSGRWLLTWWWRWRWWRMSHSPFLVSVPLKLWFGNSCGVALQHRHAARRSFRVLSFLYCRWVCGQNTAGTAIHWIHSNWDLTMSP